MNKKFFILFTLMITFSSEGFLQTANIGSKLYFKQQNNWYLQDASGENFLVNKEVITIKFKNDVTSSAINQFESQNNLVLLRKNKLAYADYQIPSGSDIIPFFQNISTSSLIESIHINTFGVYGLVPDDTLYPDQWYLEQASDRDIDASQAWNITTGNNTVTVAILDSGTDWTHEDLGLGTDSYQNIFLNLGEDPWANPNDPSTGNGLDDDGNGLVDDWKGWNFDANVNDSRTGNSHGTHVAGIVAAKTNNGKGVSGVAGGFGNEGAKMLIVALGGGAPNFSILDDAIIYAADMGVKVIQMSIGGSQDPAIDAAINYAYSLGVFMVAISGNQGIEDIWYPGSHPLVFSVGSTTKSDAKAGNSNFNSELDIAAPGVEILSTRINNTYGSGSGTSFAAPVVSGIAALMLAVNPCLTPLQIKEILHSTAEKVGGYDYNWNPDKPGHSIELGYGRVNAVQAVSAASVSYDPGVDLYSKNWHDDFGEEPYTGTGKLFVSTDVWVRKKPDGLIHQIHQNPEYSSTNDPTQLNFVYVRVRNKGCQASLGTEILELRWSKGATSSSWPSHWDGSIDLDPPNNALAGDLINSLVIPVLPWGRSYSYLFMESTQSCFVFFYSQQSLAFLLVIPYSCC